MSQTVTSNGRPHGTTVKLRVAEVEQPERAQARKARPTGRATPCAGRPSLASAPLAPASTSLSYLTTVLPLARAQTRVFAARARGIPDLRLRELALASLEKRGNIEGAALFATLAPPSTRSATVRALVAFQAAYNYTDALSEQPNADPGANAEQLHQALLVALHPDAAHPDYYAHNRSTGGDGGYLVALADSSRRALAELPGHRPIGMHARQAAARIVDFQTLNRRRVDGGHDALEGWARELRSPAQGWWETAAAAGSSLAVHALIAAAARPEGAVSAEEIDRAYFPWIGALHSLLDSVVDRDEDLAAGQPSLLDPYGSDCEVTAGIWALAVASLEACEQLADAARHRAILTAMCSYYLSAPECNDPLGRSLRAGLETLLGASLRGASAMFGARRLAHSLARRPYL